MPSDDSWLTPLVTETTIVMRAGLWAVQARVWRRSRRCCGGKMERGACAGHLPCHAACSAHTGEVNFSWWISGIGLVTRVIDIEYHAIIATIIMIIAIINCLGAGWRLLQLGSARRHPCHSLQPLLHRVLPHPSSSFFVLSLTATPF